MINFITYTNNGFYTFADLQIENFRKDFLQNHTLRVFCADSESYEYHKNKILPNNVSIKKLPVEIVGHHSYKTGTFEKLTRLKLPLVLDYMSKLNSPIWFIDNDILMFQDPEPYIDLTKDILFQADCHEQAKYCWVCSGCFWANNTEATKEFLKKIIEVQKYSNRGDQECLNDYCKSWPKDYRDGYVTPDMWGDILQVKEAKLDIFPYYLFQSGHIAFKMNQFDKHNCVMIHFNHEIPYETKLSNLQKAIDHYGI
jgi:hypothetical protein